MAAYAAALGGPRVRIQDVSESSSRGWGILRSQWRDFVAKRGDIPDRILADLEIAAPPQRPTSLDLTKDGFDRMLDKIMAHHASDSPRSLAKLSVWQTAATSNNELRVVLGDPWLHRREDSERNASQACPAKDPAMAFFPTDWANCLTEETIAELVLDAYTSTFCDAFLDGAISLVEVSNKWNATHTLSQSMSEPTLAQPKANRRLRNTSHADKALMSLGLAEQDSSPSEGFTQGGLSKDSFEAWNSRNFHKCKPLEPFAKRIEKATEAQRPTRRLTKRPEESPHQPKYVWPMAATNFPTAWERSSYRPRTMAAPTHTDEDTPTDKWLLKIGKDGKTTFPYSLVSHRAFLESQPDEILKEKARKIAPLRFSSP